MLKIDPFSFGNAYIANIHQRFLSPIIPQEKERDSFYPQNQTLLGKDSTWMVDRLEIPRVVDCFIFFPFYTIELPWVLQTLSFVSSSKRESQIVVTIGTLLHHIHVEF